MNKNYSQESVINGKSNFTLIKTTSRELLNKLKLLGNIANFLNNIASI